MKKSLRYAIFAAIALVVIGISAGVAVWFNLQNEAAKKQTETESQPRRVDPAVKKADDADKIAYEGGLQQGIDALDAAIQNTNDKHEKSILYSQKGILLFNNKKNDDALTAAKQAFELEQTVDGAAFVGQIALAKGDKTIALEYYKKARDLITTDENPMAETDKKYYTDIITQIESGTA